MIPVDEALYMAQNDARELMTRGLYDMERNIPMRASSHTDLWPGDRWVEAYLAIDEPQLAERVMATTLRSIRPDGSLPHLMQGSHRRSGIETRWIDRQVYRLQGNGAMELPNGEWVTKSYGAPTLALGAVALADRNRKYPDFETVTRTITTLYDARGNSDDLIEARKVDELTNNSGKLADQLKKEGKAMDPAVNALAVKSLMALRQYPGTEKSQHGRDLFNQAERTVLALYEELELERSKDDPITGSRSYLKGEQVLALARLNDPTMMPSEYELWRVFKAPEAGEKHPEHSNLNLAECLEIARLTRWADASNKYLERVIPKIAAIGAAGLTRFEGIIPGKNEAANKAGRKQVWLPTAAEIVQIDL
jgi:hypothetical protein